ncbi:MAG: helix-turn-helix domain-containing protein, partial [Cyanobacteria bacterium P01_F01_bin.143]
MGKSQYIVKLEESEQSLLKAIVKKGKGGAFKIRRAQILLHSDQNGLSLSGSEIAKLLHCRQSTIYEVRKKFVEEG